MNRSLLFASASLIALLVACDDCPPGAVCVEDPPAAPALREGAWTLRLSRLEAVGPECGAVAVEDQALMAMLDTKADGGVVLEVEGVRLLGRQDGATLFVEGSPEVARPMPAEEPVAEEEDAPDAAFCSDGDDPATGSGGGSSPGYPGGGGSGGGGSSPGHPGGGAPEPEPAPIWVTLDASVQAADRFAGELRVSEGPCELVADVVATFAGDVVVSSPDGGATEPYPGDDADADGVVSSEE